MIFKMLDTQLLLLHFTTNYCTYLQGKMKAYSLFIITICCIYRYTSVEIKPELKKNILKFGYDINYKYERMLAHSFNKFNVITKFRLPTIKDFKISKLKFNNNCEYLRENNKEHSEEVEQHILDLLRYCNKIKSHVNFYKNQIKSPNETVHHTMKNETDLILLQFPMNRKDKRGIFTLIITGFIGLAYEGILSFLHHRRHKALHKAVKAMETKTNI